MHAYAKSKLLRRNKCFLIQDVRAFGKPVSKIPFGRGLKTMKSQG